MAKSLKSGSLAFYEVVAQSVANIAPSATPALIVPLVFASAGNGTWLAYGIATLAMLFMAAQINVFASRSASPGALYTFVSLGLGKRWGALAGWSLIVAYVFTASATLAGFTNYFGVVLDALFQFHFGKEISFLVMLSDVAACWWIARQDVQLSTRAMLILEFASVGMIVILAAVFFIHSGHLLDGPQLEITGVSTQGLRMALVLALFSFVGFESATALGDEAKNPLKSIPRSVSSSVVVVGIFFTMIAATLVTAFRGSATPLDKSSSPLVDLANLTGLPKFGLPLAIGALIGQFACALACVNAAARVMYSMAHLGLFPVAARKVHDTHSTPHVAVAAAAAASGFVPLVLLIHGTAVMDIFGYLGSLATFGFLLSYVLITIAAPVYLRGRNELTKKGLAVSAATIMLLLIPIIGSVYPVPDAPYNYLPYVFIALMTAGHFGTSYLQSRSVEKTTES